MLNTCSRDEDSTMTSEGESSSCGYRWDAISARRMADCIHNEVRQMVGTSRLVRKTEGVALVNRSELTVGKIMGKGAFSEVHEVCLTNDPRRRRYAMKHLKMKLMSQPDNFRLAAAELAVEAHMLASFDHPNILKIQGWAANGVASFVEGAHDSFFLLLDCLDETLDQRILKWQHDEDFLTQHRAPPTCLMDVWRQTLADDVGSTCSCNSTDVITAEKNQIHLEKLKVLAEIAAALSYLHDRGVIFRDLKPNNIGLLNGRVQIFDFGLSRELPGCDLTEPFEMSGKVGTLRYMAVEVASHQRYNVSADVYSWAMVCYETITCKKPFAGWTREMHQDLVCHQGMRPDIQCVPSTLKPLLNACWDQNPHARPTMAQAHQQILYLEEQQVFLCLQQQQAKQQQAAAEAAAAVQQQQLLQQQQQQMQAASVYQAQARTPTPPHLYPVANPVTVELPIGFDVHKSPSRHFSETYTAATLSLSNDSYGF